MVREVIRMTDEEVRQVKEALLRVLCECRDDGEAASARLAAMAEAAKVLLVL